MTLDDGTPSPFGRGLPRDVTRNVKIVQFNDAAAVSATLEPRDVAIVLTEPALTNNVGLQLPQRGFHDALRAVTRETGTVLTFDETHTHVVDERGCTGLFGLEPDIVTIGKAIAGGIPMGAVGMSDALADELEGGEVATGGTLFGNPLSMAAARAALGEVLVPGAYEHTSKLGARLADGIEGSIREAGLPWTVHRFGPRSGVTFRPSMPANAREARAVFDSELSRLARMWFANRGVWEALVGAGPTISVPATDEDVDRYIEAYAAFLRELTA